MRGWRGADLKLIWTEDWEKASGISPLPLTSNWWAEFPAILRSLTNKRCFFARNKASSSLQIDEQNVGALWANNLSPQFVWGWSVWKVYLHLETMLWVVAAHYILKRHQTHTRLFALQHRANPGGKRRRKKKKGYKFRKMSLCQQQSHSGSSLLRNDWGPNKPLTGLVLPGAGHGLSIWSCCLVVAE